MLFSAHARPLADEFASGDTDMSGDDSDCSDGDDSDDSDLSSGDDAIFFDEQYLGEADDPNAQDDPFVTCCSPADLALALMNDASLARHPDVVKLVAFFTENAMDGDEPAMSSIAKICAGAPDAQRIAALRSRCSLPLQRLASTPLPHRRSGRGP